MKEYIIKAKEEREFVLVPNETAQDKTLSWAARGMLTYLLSLPPDWKIYISELSDRSPNGKDHTRKVFEELKDAGLIEGQPGERVNGKFATTQYTVFSKKNRDSSEINHCGKPGTGKPDTVLPDTENPPLQIKHSTKETSTKETFKGEKDFEWAKRCIDSLYRETLVMIHKDKDIDQAIAQAYGDLTANENEWRNCDSSQFKRKVNYQLGRQSAKKEFNGLPDQKSMLPNFI